MSIVKKAYNALVTVITAGSAFLFAAAIAAVVYSSEVLVFFSLWHHELVYLYFAVPCKVIGVLTTRYLNKKG